MKERQQYYSFYNSDDPQRWGRAEMSEQRGVTERWIGSDSDKVVLELGCGIGALRDVHPNYIGLEFSLTALRRFPGKARRVNADMQHLPFRDKSVDFIFSWTTLEHVPHPDQTLVQIERVLKSGGIALLAPAWNCRSWASKALPIRSYRELSWPDRINKGTIPIRNSLVWRGIFAIPVRIYREIRLVLSGEPLSFDYRRLSPELSEYVYTDCDAFASMDPHAAIMYYLSRGWQILSHPTFIRRFFARHEPVVVRKPIVV